MAFSNAFEKVEKKVPVLVLKNPGLILAVTSPLKIQFQMTEKKICGSRVVFVVRRWYKTRNRFTLISNGVKPIKSFYFFVHLCLVGDCVAYGSLFSNVPANVELKT